MTTKQDNDQGFTLIEVLIVVVILALLAVAVVASVGGITGEAEASGCESDAHILVTATEAYFAQKQATSILATGTSDDRYEITLRDQKFLRSPSAYHDLNSDGSLKQVSGSPCTVT